MNEFTRKAMELAEDWLDAELKRYRGLKHAHKEARSALLAHLEGGEQKWLPMTDAPKDPRRRILLRWLSGKSNWICIGAWASSEDSPRLKMKGCPREGWMPDAGTCIPINQKDCIGWQPVPATPTEESP